ncbi:MAG: hypothetical protein ACXU8U_06220 [Asticcacaulis sp.]
MRTLLSPKWLITPAALIASAMFATHAMAECDDDQTDLVGKLVAVSASAKITNVVPGAGKQMINVDSCEVGGGGLIVKFKFNVIGADGLYWAAGEAKVVGGRTVSEIKFTGLSPNLASASAKSGVKLASS